MPIRRYKVRVRYSNYGLVKIQYGIDSKWLSPITYIRQSSMIGLVQQTNQKSAAQLYNIAIL